MLQRQQMFAPFRVDRLQQQLFFDHAHVFGAELLGLFDHLFIGSFSQTFDDFFGVHAFFGGPFNHLGL